LGAFKILQEFFEYETSPAYPVQSDDSVGWMQFAVFGRRGPAVANGAPGRGDGSTETTGHDHAESKGDDDSGSRDRGGGPDRWVIDIADS
jgi:hypothetical protein